MFIKVIGILAIIIFTATTSVQAAVWYDKIPESGDYVPVEENNIQQPKDFEDLNTVPPDNSPVTSDQIAEDNAFSPPVSGAVNSESFLQRYWIWVISVLLLVIAGIAGLLKKRKDA